MCTVHYSVINWVLWLQTVVLLMRVTTDVLLEP